MTEGWKFYDIKDKAKNQGVKDSTINTEMGLIKELHDYYLGPKGRVQGSFATRKELDVNLPATNDLLEDEEVRGIRKWIKPKGS